MFYLSLNGDWTIRRESTGECFPGKVPGTVLEALYRAGKTGDPFYRDNEENLAPLFEDEFTFIREFVPDENLLKSGPVYLECLGLDTLAEIVLNGIAIARTLNMHRTYEIDCSRFLREGKNTLEVRFNSPVKFIEEKDAARPLWGANEAMKGFPHIRKAHFMFGWDWGPKLPDSGIWRRIGLKGFSGASFSKVKITERLDGGTGIINIKADINIYENSQYKYRYIISGPGGFHRDGIFPVKSDSISFEISISGAESWWPNGLGGQPLYSLTLELLDKEVLDSRIFTVGFRNFALKTEKDDFGESFGFEINGKNIFAMGACLIPPDSLICRDHREKLERLVNDCKRANFNCLRVWGGGYYPDDYFYELCDRAGILVWQDFMFACGVYSLDDGFLENVRMEAVDNLLRISHHPCLAVLCGNNEMELAWKEWDFPKTGRLRKDYIKLFEKVLPEICRENAPGVFYRPSSPSSGGRFVNPNDESRGDAHYWDVWHKGKPFSEYRRHYFRFVSEFGFQSMPALETVNSFTEPADRNVFSYIMEKHQKNAGANGLLLRYLSDNFLYPKDLDAFIYASQLLQAEAVRTGVEHWRSHKGRCMGAVYWQLNDCWPGLSWSSIDYYGRWKALHYFARRFFSPVLLCAAADGYKVTVYIANEMVDAIVKRVKWKLRETGGDVLKKGTFNAECLPMSANSFGVLDFGDELAGSSIERTAYFECYLENEEDSSYQSILFVKPGHFSFPDPALRPAVMESEGSFGILVESSAMAKYVEIRIKGMDAVFSDNYFDMPHGGVKDVLLQKKDLAVSLSIKELQEKISLRSVFDIA